MEIRSYWAWVPTNFTHTIPALYCISTTNRYLLPLILILDRQDKNIARTTNARKYFTSEEEKF
jgi:hypothetical protein